MKTGTVHNRDSFLARISSTLGRDKVESTVSRPKWSYSPQLQVLENATQDELIAVLEEQCKSIHTDFVHVQEGESLESALSSVIEAHGGGSAITWNDPRFQEHGLASFLQNKDTSIWNPAIGRENISLAEKANIGITFSDITLAESGTVVLFSGAEKGRVVSLLPTTYIALIPKSTIVPRMTQATSFIHNSIENGAEVASCINFITGPSNSADIEMNLVVGVHGPIKATYIVF